MRQKNKRFVSWVLAFCMMLICALVPVAGAEDAGNEAKIGETEYATLGEAIDASKDGDTITLLRDLTMTIDKKAYIYKDITIDGGEAMYKISAAGYYTFQFCDSFTLKNLKMDTQAGFRFYNTSKNGREAVVGTLENVEWTLSTGLLVNLQGEKTGIPQTLNLIRSTITKTAVAGDPIIATYDKGGSDITINIEDSVLNQYGGQTKTHVGNQSMLYFYQKGNVTLNVKGSSTLNYTPLGKADSVQALAVIGSATLTVNLENTVRLHLAESEKATANHAFFYKNGTGTAAVNDAGAAWSATRAVAAEGILKPGFDSYNGETTIRWSLKDGDRLVPAGAESPFRYETTSETVLCCFSTFTYRQEDFVMNAGAAIRTEAPNAMQISGAIAKTLADYLEEVGHNITYELFLVKKADLEATKLGGEVYNLQLLGGRDKKQVNRIYWSESEDGKTLLFRGCVYGLDAEEEYVMVAAVTFLFGEEEMLYHSEIVEADHVRSVRGIAARALEDAEYAGNAYLKSLVSGAT